MKVLILAAGGGKRLLPLTNEIPKCLLSINSKSILEYQLEAICRSGLSDVVIVLGYRYEKVISFLKKIGDKFRSLNIKIVINGEFKDTNSGYSFWLAKNFLNDDVIYINGDLLFDASVLINLKKSNFSNAIIIDRDVTKDSKGSRMVRALVNQEDFCIKNMSWDIEGNALAVGPVKLSKLFIKEMISCLDRDIVHGINNSYCYIEIGKIAKNDANLFGIDIKSGLWAEIDDFDDYEKARAIFKSIT